MLKMEIDWSRLPDVVVVQIFSYLSFADKVKSSHTCRTWKNCLSHPSSYRSFTLEFSQRKCLNRGLTNPFARDEVARAVRDVSIDLHSDQDNCDRVESQCHVKQCLQFLAKIAKTNTRLQKFTFRPNSFAHRWIAVSSEVRTKFTNCFQKIVSKSRSLQHFAPGLIKMNLSHIDLNKHVNSLQSLHLQTCMVMNTDIVGDSMQLAPAIIDKLENLRVLGLDYHNLSGPVMEALSKEHSPVLDRLVLNVHEEIASDSLGIITDEKWAGLLLRSPNLQVTVNFLHSPPLTVTSVLCPSMPLTVLRMFYGLLQPETVSHMYKHYSHSLTELVVFEHALNDGDTIDQTDRCGDQLVMLSWKCDKLRHLSVIGPPLSETNLIGIVRLRGKSLACLRISEACVSERDSDEFYSVKKLSKRVQKEIAEQLGDPSWQPLTSHDLPNFLFDPEQAPISDEILENEYLDYILGDQA